VKTFQSLSSLAPHSVRGTFLKLKNGLKAESVAQEWKVNEMSEEHVKIQIKIQKDIHPKIYNYLREITKTRRCEAARMLMQKALNDKALIENILNLLPNYSLVIAQTKVDEAKESKNQDKEDLSFLDDLKFTPEDFENH
jgi:hypothetical protein